MSAASENPRTDPPPATSPGGLAGWTHSAFFRVHSPRLEALIRGRLSPRFQARFDAADIVQSAFRSFFLRLPPASGTGDAETDLWPLLAEIAVRKLSQQIRRHSAQRRNVEADVVGPETASSDASPDEAASLAEIISLTQHELDDPARQAFALRLEGFEILEIAERLDLSERTVRRHLSSAKQVLQRLLELEPAPLAPALKNEQGRGVRGTEQPPMSDARIPLNFADYILQQLIGEGAVGKVYRALEKITGCTVAVKYLKKAFRFHPQAVASFLHEVQIVSQLNHPGIMRIRGLGQTPGGGHFIVMDWAPGGDLARRVATHRPSLSEIRQWMLELTGTLQHAHEHGVIHCDLKPSNVLIGAGGRLQLTDFGLARQLVGWPDHATAAGGTPAFIAPELIEPSFGLIGPWTDVFGLGAILFNLLTGRPPYEGRHLDAVQASIVSPACIAWPPLTEHPIPDEWRSACDKLISKAVQSRCPDMKAAMELIQSLTL